MVVGLVVVALAYAIGSIPFGYLIVRQRTGRDIRALGSGSAGGRNVGRQLGPGWGLASGALDALKGAVAAAISMVAAPGWLAPAMIAVVAGHVWPVTLRFHGGRGIAPSIGAISIADPPTAAATVIVFAIVALVARRTAPGLVAGIIVAPVFAIVAGRPTDIVLGVLGCAAIVVVAHASHLERATRRDPGFGR